ncbi:MAG: CAP domain-containing protein [Polyangiaceae bacterium]|nr:CAP domain-containing protein [Polyangiaceae bacterium]
MKRRPRSFRWTAIVAGPLALGCGGSGSAAAGTATAAEVEPTGPLLLEDARAFVLALVNRDRADQGLPPVTIDPTASEAAQIHAEDMARHGFTSHWGTDGSVPEQRYTEAGGIHLAQENAACFFDGKERELEVDPTFLPDELRKIESAFIDEVPPKDGHRTNILKPGHSGLGIGLARPVGVEQLCMAQEFTDVYGTYRPLPQRGTVGQRVTIAGQLQEPIVFGGIGIARIDLATPLTASHLNTTSVYQIPAPYILFFPRGFKTPKPVTVNGNKFSLETTLDDERRPGRYEVSVWGRQPGSEDLMIVSLRTVVVED